ncbi:TPA: chemotaxis protein, partial [Candidatus Sumerlaeota bacterium]|nr:chemotaxis protein [Candidatus Sumerlaeota bacterium]
MTNIQEGGEFMRQVKLGTKIAAGYLVVLLLTVGLGILAIYNMLGVKKDSDILSKEYVPAVQAANDVQRNAAMITFYMVEVSLLESEKRWGDATKSFVEMEKALETAQAVAKSSTN